ncbi:FKBP-type peptidyl-prolyl cis-trans isomerase [Prevotella sp. A2931]|uniref:Peptidyl-prolyl cis-trans isomerase n=1 Tax=Prevotella illustrans TaxID=2800387 RepID=A0ABS3M583_9BACT|nr:MULTISPECIES: FKBP-type peptidyl-prolyl cis-trans isomerase [Prevotella]MBO1363341.1 FKBP-type peptidyl-prolyl cis-trans isomerase [Prevotella illustrans]PTL26975.1 peptidylprolyl isomerase [Prevotella sp. oral taxon 820]
MKKFFVFLILSLAVAQLGLQAKDIKKVKLPEKSKELKLVTKADSLSYAAGVTMTNGLRPFLEQQLKVDTNYMEAFNRGFAEARVKMGDKEFDAYLAGLRVAQMIAPQVEKMAQDLSAASVSLNTKIFDEAFLTAASAKPTLLQRDSADKMFRSAVEAAAEAASAAYKQSNEQWLKDNATKADVKTTASGLQYKVIKAGNGPMPKATDRVTVKYAGKTIDGVEFDSSYKRNPQTTTFGCGEVIKGWTEALMMMPVGSKWEIYIPQELAYGNRQAGQIKPYSTLIFTVELVGIEKPAEKANK